MICEKACEGHCGDHLILDVSIEEGVGPCLRQHRCLARLRWSSRQEAGHERGTSVHRLGAACSALVARVAGYEERSEPVL